MQSTRMLGMTITLAAVGMTSLAVEYVRNSLGDDSTLTGWTLLVATSSLYLLTWRKRRAGGRLGKVSIWLQWHVYAGSFASIVFLMHIGWPIRGWFESGLAAMFMVVAVSGIGLSVLSRVTPRRLSALPADHRLEQIPALQASLANRAHQLALESAGLGEGATLAEFYQRRLLPYFVNTRNLWYRLLPTGGLRRQLERELNDLDRYLAASGVERRAEILQLVREKDDLDYHSALQTRLRGLFQAHVALTWALALMVMVHVILVYRFQGAW